MNNSYELKEVCFDEIFDVWSKKLWPHRDSKILPISAIGFDGKFDKKIEQSFPYFFAIFDGNNIIAVNSGYLTSESYFRSRGLYVEEAFRGKGFARKVLNATEVKANELGAKFIWSMPRNEALIVYEKAGYDCISKPIQEGFEYGPNYLVVKKTIQNETFT